MSYLQQFSTLAAKGMLFATLLSTDVFAAEDWRPAEPKSPAEWYGQTIRDSAWRTPGDELAGFHVPQGFRVELVASEPQIAKPMNLAFDRAGRLWMTQSVQYPFPAKEGAISADAVLVLEDRDRDGQFETTRRFADGLNIPIGILPYEDGCFVFSIPNIWRLRDTDGDGVCDRREVVLGPFDTSRDTHGMVNAFRDGGDGWIYACHGFNNISRVAGTDGHKIELTSGNTFRFRPDGSRVEQYTQGQVNPFGMTRDAYGNWFTADCHSKPLTQLLRGACYPSFGRPDDGLGFVPPMMDHLHGSTAISGAAVVPAGIFPAAFQGDLFCGNVMTCRINRNRVEYQGATAKAYEMPDLLTSDDPWFRPVDLQFGPDGCLYIADFYNKIIGHYEVPLDHPDRDRTSGRIWRIRWTGGSEQIAAPKLPAASSSLKSVESLDQAVSLLRKAHTGKDTIASLQRLRGIEFLADHGSIPLIPDLMESLQKVDSAFDPILAQAHWIAMRDIVQRATERNEPFPSSWASNEMSEGVAMGWIRICRAIRNPVAASWLLEILDRYGSQSSDAWQANSMRDALLHAATTADEAAIPRVLELLQKSLPDNASRMQQILVIAEAQKARNGKLSSKLIELGRQSIQDSITDWQQRFADAAIHVWVGRADRGRDDREWPVENRMLESESGQPSRSESVWSSIGLGERYTGTWTSSPWTANDAFTFWIVGHNALPSEPDTQRNYVRLLVQNRTTRDWKEVARMYPPRSDIGKRVTVDLTAYQGSQIRLQVVDGDGHDAYAWIAVGGFSQPGLAMGPHRQAYEQLLRVARCFGPSIVSKSQEPENLDLLNRWQAWLEASKLDPASRTALQRSWFGTEAPLASELVDCVVSQGWEDILATQPVWKSPDGALRTLPPYTWSWPSLDPRTLEWIAEQYCVRANATAQEDLALRWSKHRASIPVMESLMRRGIMSKEVLRTFPMAWWDALSEEDAQRLAGLKPEGETDTARASVVQNKALAVQGTTPDLTLGARMFQERCAACHQLAGQGKVIGPQLDGAITRTIERLCEDILWPNRNVDEAFRITNILTHSGETYSGLIVDRQPDSLEVVDQTGKSQRIARDEIETERISKLSLMPGNFEELMSDAELASLIGFLKSHSPTP
jgi:putative heme-binding domain-containing protein